MNQSNTETSEVDWKANSLQVALFPSQPVDPKLDVFATVFGREADASEEKPREGYRRQYSVHETTLNQVVISPLRVDISSTAHSEPSLDVKAAAVSFEDFVPSLQKFAAMVCKGVPALNIPLIRISIIAVAVAEAETREDTYKILSQGITSVKVTPEMNDLSFRVNWHAKTAHLSEGYLNRLTTWSAFKLAIMAGFSPDKGVALGARNFARLDLDINTPAERTEVLPADQIATIFQEMFDLAQENAERGECR